MTTTRTHMSKESVLQADQDPPLVPVQSEQEREQRRREKVEREVPMKEAAAAAVVVMNGRERLKRHRAEMAGQVWIPEIWGQEDLLKDWVDCTVFDKSLGNNSIVSARAAMVQQAAAAAARSSKIITTTSPGGGFMRRIENRC